MKLSKGTLAVLKNYSSINTNILVEPGSTISTITPAKNLLSEARVEEDFTTRFGTYLNFLVRCPCSKILISHFTTSTC